MRVASTFPWSIGSASRWTDALALVRRELWTAGIFSAVINACMLMPSLYMLQVYDRVLISQSEVTLWASTVLLVAVLLLVAGVEVMRSRLLIRMGVRLDQALSPSVFDTSLQAQLLRPAGQPSQFLADLTQLRQFLTGNAVFALFDTPWFLIYVGALFVLHPVLGWVGLAFAALLMALAWLSHRWTSAGLQGVLLAGIDLANDQAGKLRNASAIEAMGMLERLRAAWWRRYADLAQEQGRLDDLSHRLSAASKFLRYTQQSLSLGAGAWLVVQGEISPGAMIVGNMLMTRALQPLDQLVSSWRMLASAQAARRRLDDLARHLPTPRGPLRQDPLGELELRQLSLRVPSRHEPVLQDLSLRLPAGHLLGVVGPSGSGKTSLARMMLGSLPPSSGQVLLDGAEWSRWDDQALGRHLGYLPQDVELLDGTLAQNIARFEEPDSERVIAAAQATGIHDMILRQPKGYDTLCGEGGERFSAGQKQRIALARAIYGWPRVVVLDEPNANLDEAGHTALAAVLDQLRQRQCSVVLISHRLSILHKADTVVLLKNGRIVHQGSPAQVLAPMAPQTLPSEAASTTSPAQGAA